jgi:pentatricopeptide repeat protein
MRRVLATRLSRRRPTRVVAPPARLLRVATTPPPPAAAHARCVHSAAESDAGAEQLLQALQAEAQAAAPVFQPQHLRAVVELVDGADDLVGGGRRRGRRPAPLPGADGVPPPPLALDLDSDGGDGDEGDGAEVATEAEGALARVLATREARLGEHILAVVASAPGELADRAEMLGLLAHALSASPWLSGQLLAAVAHREVHAARGNSSLATTTLLLDDWVSCASEGSADPEAAGLAPVLLSVLEAAARCEDISLALRVLVQLQEHSGADKTAVLAAYKLLLLMAARSSAPAKAEECSVPVRAGLAVLNLSDTQLDAEFHTLLFRAELAVLPAATKREKPAQIQKLATESVAAQCSASLVPEDELFTSWVNAHAAAGHFERKYLDSVDGVLKGVSQTGQPPAPRVCAALLAGALGSPELKPRALQKRLKALERKLRAAGWTGHTEESYYELLKALANRQQVGSVAALEILEKMRQNGLVPSPACYSVVINGLLRNGAGGQKHKAEPWSVAEIAALRLAVARHVREPELDEPFARPKHAPGSSDGDTESEAAVEEQKKLTPDEYRKEQRRVAEWATVAEQVGTGRTWRACHKRWRRVSKALETESSPTTEMLGKADDPALSTGEAPAAAAATVEELAALEQAIRKVPTGQMQQQPKPARQKAWGLKTAIKCLRQMVREGQTPSIGLCNAVLRSCVANFRPWMALGLLDEMKKWGVEPNETSLNHIVQACVRVKVGFTGRAIRLLDDIPLNPMDETWVALLGACLASPHPRAWEATLAVANRAVSSKLATASAVRRHYSRKRHSSNRLTPFAFSFELLSDNPV